ncbi:hypothetical protein SVIO_109620 [Streptomyces violaceusniger]|uniref:HTH tetR-type domain-containing protein n=1 Tax=Streptomyces violaceusniger TaxID=68280 RepID=A0A4D4LR62_STRVO|nr:hypothetical protein SVIO_109620 [Streptomyces violaceusniger]
MAQRKRQLVSNELSEAALQLLALKGFDAVTIDEIAATAGVSKRTFFRYFASKEDVVVQFLADMGTGMRAALASRPSRSSLPRPCSTPSGSPWPPAPTIPTGHCAWFS